MTSPESRHAGVTGAAAPDLGETLVPAPTRVGPQFPVLDTLRGVGAVCVVATHVAFWSGDYLQHGVWGVLLSRLDVGVALFFVLSGFLLSRPWLAGGSERRPATAPYLWRRLVRIAPLYLVTVVLALALITQNDGVGPGGWARSLLMLDTFTASSLPAGLTHMWSLAVEVSFYLVLPLVMVALLGRRGRSRTIPVRRVLVGLAAMVAIGAWWHLDGAGRAGSLGEVMPGQWLPGYLGWFSGGILLALVQVLHEQGRSASLTRPFVRLARQPGSCWVLILGLMLVASTPLAGPSLLEAPTPGQALFKSLLYGVVGVLVVLTGVFPTSGTYATAMAHPAARRLGYVSFGVFCLHLPLLHLVMWVTPWNLFQAPLLGLFLVTLATSLVAAELAYRLVERPAMRLRNVGPGRSPRRHRGDGSEGRDGSTRVDPTTSSDATGTTTR